MKCILVYISCQSVGEVPKVVGHLPDPLRRRGQRPILRSGRYGNLQNVSYRHRFAESDYSLSQLKPGNPRWIDFHAVP